MIVVSVYKTAYVKKKMKIEMFIVTMVTVVNAHVQVQRFASKILIGFFVIRLRLVRTKF